MFVSDNDPAKVKEFKQAGVETLLRVLDSKARKFEADKKAALKRKRK